MSQLHANHILTVFGVCCIHKEDDQMKYVLKHIYCFMCYKAMYSAYYYTITTDGRSKHLEVINK